MRTPPNLKLRLVNATICQANTFTLALAIASSTGPPQNATPLAFLCLLSARSCKLLPSSPTIQRAPFASTTRARNFSYSLHITIRSKVLSTPSASPVINFHPLSIITIFPCFFAFTTSHPIWRPFHGTITWEIWSPLNWIASLSWKSIVSKDPALIRDLEARATLPAIVDIALTHPKGFSAYCTVSNTVKAIGIGGVASLFLSVKISEFLTSTREAQARNLVALTRSKGLRVLYCLPLTDSLPPLYIFCAHYAPSVTACSALVLPHWI